MFYVVHIWRYIGVCPIFERSDKAYPYPEPNDEWLKAQVASAEYSSKSEVINDLIRQARRRQLEIEHIRSELIKAEQSGFIDEQPEDLLANFKDEARRDGFL